MTAGFGIVVIGRNEGVRLMRCLETLVGSGTVVYVDSGSSDGSVETARRSGAEVVELDASKPFTAALARNAGFGRLQNIAPGISYVQFVDGDCELQRGWVQAAISFLQAHPDVAVVCGRLRERHPEKSIYNWLCDKEWDRPAGEIRACGGVAMMRVEPILASGGYREDLIAGEEPELCLRFRAGGWRVWRLDAEMATHDAAMTRFGQWFRRAVRAGYGFACIARLHLFGPERLYVRQALRGALLGVCLPLFLLGCGLSFGGWAWVAWLFYPLHVVHKVARGSGPLRDRVILAIFQMLAVFPHGIGEIKFIRDCFSGSRLQLIEYGKN
jgi:glycosyltransferase involved in cell wall biosynthesis